MTKEELIAAGADYDGGLALCMNNEDFFFKMIRKGLANPKFDSLKKNLDEKKYEEAFEDAHALKGVAGNLHLTSLYDAIAQLVEPLRQKDFNTDYNALYSTVKEKLEAFKKAAE